MMRRVAIFSGFDPKMIEQIRRPLEGSQFRIVHMGKADKLNEDYFNGLVKNCLFVLNQIGSDRNDIHGLLFSCVAKREILSIEESVFFPALRRRQIDIALRADVRQSKKLLDIVMESFRILSETRKVLPNSDKIAIHLPLENAQCAQLTTAIRQIYSGTSYELIPSARRRVIRVKGSRALRVGALTFTPALNNERHPVRRTSDRDQCDLSALLRLGYSVNSRFEFDVSSQRVWDKHRFSHCDGRTEAVPAGTSHVNMRINGDFGCSA